MRRLTLGVLTIGMINGCVAWRPVSLTPQQVLARKPEEVIRVATGDSANALLVYQPRIIGDTLTGHPSETAILRLAIPVRNITQVSTRYRHVGKTMLAGIAIAAGVLVYGLLQSLNGSQP